MPRGSALLEVDDGVSYRTLGPVLAVHQSDRPPRRDWGSGPRRLGETGRQARLRVLIVDDDEDSRDLSAWCLRAAGWSVRVVANGAEALLAVTRLEPDVILMDLRMPVLGGVETIRQLKLDEVTRHVPIVACSAFDHGLSAVEAVAAGCDAFVAKPFEPEDVRDLLEGLVGRGSDSSG